MTDADSTPSSNRALSRRHYLSGVVTLDAIGLAGCASQLQSPEVGREAPLSSLTETETSATTTEADSGVIDVGAGSDTTTLPSGEETPPEQVYATSNLSAPYPTNDWWSSVLFTQCGSPMWAHPVVGTPTSEGLDRSDPTEWTFSNASGDSNRNNVAYNAPDTATTVTFSDGVSLSVPANALATTTANSDTDDSNRFTPATDAITATDAANNTTTNTTTQ